MARNCEECVYFDYDEELESYVCGMDLDEDEMERFLRGVNDGCPFYRRGDDYQSGPAAVNPGKPPLDGGNHSCYAGAVSGKQS